MSKHPHTVRASGGSARRHEFYARHSSLCSQSTSGTHSHLPSRLSSCNTDRSQLPGSSAPQCQLAQSNRPHLMRSALVRTAVKLTAATRSYPILVHFAAPDRSVPARHLMPADAEPLRIVYPSSEPLRPHARPEDQRSPTERTS